MRKETSDQVLRLRFRLRTGYGGRAGQALRLRSGQAMIEFMLGLVGIAVVVAMLAQISFIVGGDTRPGHEIDGHTRMVINARNEMAKALAGDSSGTYDADYLANWEAGPDGYKNTADDTSTKGDDGSFLNGLGNTLGSGDFMAVLQGQGFQNEAYSKLSGGSSGNMGESLGIYRVEGQTTLTNSLAVQKLVTGTDEIVFEHEIFMPQVSDLWESSGLQ